MFTEPNLAFSVAAVDGEYTTLRVHLSLEAAAGRPGWTTDPRPGIYEYSVPLRVDRAQLLTAAEQWCSDLAPFPARRRRGTAVVGRSPRLWLVPRAHPTGRAVIPRCGRRTIILRCVPRQVG
ncbi:WapI family immunity protein [Kineococcus sp. NBC_00420]|uniref:WapI family immunity protein n=1 Tax=Kineococcus sp. NBC_00420 TaxID=2903564 RepID=UPI003FA5317A